MFEFFNGDQAFDPKVHEKLSQKPGICGLQNAQSKLWEHGGISGE
jgi:hypothetical protein